MMIVVTSELVDTAVDFFSKFPRYSIHDPHFIDNAEKVVPYSRVASVSSDRIELSELLSLHANHRNRYIHRQSERTVRFIEYRQSTNSPLRKKAKHGAQDGVHRRGSERFLVSLRQYLVIHVAYHPGADNERAELDELVALTCPNLGKLQLVSGIRQSKSTNAHDPSSYRGCPPVARLPSQQGSNGFPRAKGTGADEDAATDCQRAYYQRIPMVRFHSRAPFSGRSGFYRLVGAA